VTEPLIRLRSWRYINVFTYLLTYLQDERGNAYDHLIYASYITATLLKHNN